jgi:hypothetical protein
VGYLNVDLIDTRLRLQVAIPCMPGASTHGRIHDVIGIHAAPFSTGRQAARTLARELVDKHMALAALQSENVRTHLAGITAIAACDLLLGEDRLPKYIVAQRQGLLLCGTTGVRKGAA